MSESNPKTESLFAAALAMESPEERADYLDRACGTDQQLRAQVEELLAAYPKVERFLESPTRDPVATVDQPAVSERPGAVIGSYKLLQQIGEGGMGTVFLAEQTHPVQRKVALKLIKSGMDSHQVIARFEAERQALALMDHPNIAKVLDAGTTQGDRPYFVMELVKGVPITRYCDEHHLTPRQRLELFVPVCQAVQHAHQKGIIHRDLKPSNVMVCLYDGKPVPKVIDFGVAKAAGARLTEKTLFTEIGQVVGTLEYMSPEQAELNQLDIDTRSDIYSLGVLLYELLTGTTPLERKRFKEVVFLEVLRLIREEESPKPSTRLSTTEGLPSIAANRGLEPKKLSGLMRGELDWIVMKTLEKDRNRRYETANGLAMDVQRYLADEAVQACPPSAAYRLKKFLRRNKKPVLAAALVLLALVGGIIGTTLGLLEAQTSEEHAQAEATRAGQERDQANAARAAAQKASKAAQKASKAEKVQRKLAEAATAAETVQRQLVEQRGKQIRKNLYFAEMNLAGQAAESVLGLARVGELVSHWRSGQPDLRGWEWYYLFGLCHRDLLTIAVSSDAVNSVAWSPDGKRLATGSWGTGPKIWDAVTGKESVILAGGGSSVGCSVAWSPDGKLLASGNGRKWLPNQGMITVWDAVTGKQRLSFQGHTNEVLSVAWAPDGTRLASGSVDGTVKISDAKTGKATLMLKGHTARVNEVAWSRDGTRLASADLATVKIWDGASGKETLAIRAGSRAVSWSPDGSRLAAGQGIWDTATAKQQLFLSDFGGDVYSVSWSPDGKRVARGNNSGQVNICDAATGKPTVTLKGHNESVFSVAWSPDGTRLASASEDGTVKVWDAAQKNEPLPLEGHKYGVRSVSWSPNGKRLASASFDRTVKVWDAATGQMVLTFKGHTGFVLSVCFSPDGKRLASCSGEFGKPGEVKPGEVKVWDAATGQEFLTFKGHPYPVMSVAWSPNGKRLASASGNEVKIWNPVTGEGIRTFTGMNAVSWSPDGSRLALFSGSGHVGIYDAATGKPTCMLKGHMLGVNSVAWCPDGTRLASASQDRTVKIWDAATGQELLTLKGHTLAVYSVAWSPNGTRLASTSVDRKVKIWDAATAKETITFKEAGGYSVAWSPDGLRLATDFTFVSSGRTKIFIFDAANGYRRAGRSGRADASQDNVAAYRKAVERYPRSLGVHLALGRVLLANGDLDAAIAACRKAVALAPKSASAYTILGDALRAKDDKDGAIAAYRKVIELESKNTWPHTIVGDALRARGELAGALAAYRKSIVANSANPRDYLQVGEALFQRQRNHPEKGDLLGAVAVFSKALQLDPKNNAAWYNRGYAYQKLGQRDKALADFSKAIALAPDHSWALLGRAAIYGEMAQWDKAIADYTKSLKRFAQYPTDSFQWSQAYQKRGQAYQKLGKWDKAVADFGKALELAAVHTPQMLAQYQNELAWFLVTCPAAKLRNPARAVELALTSVQLAPQNGNYWNTLGLAHFRAGAWKPAVAAFNKSMELRKGGDACDYFFLAMAHQKLGKHDEARTWYNQGEQWLEKNKKMLAKEPQHAQELRRFRSEAEQVLELKKK